MNFWTKKPHNCASLYQMLDRGFGQYVHKINML